MCTKEKSRDKGYQMTYKSMARAQNYNASFKLSRPIVKVRNFVFCQDILPLKSIIDISETTIN